MSARGRFIAVEGIDGAGSTTQAKMLCDALHARGIKVHFTAEPSQGPIGLVIRQLLRGRKEDFKHLQHALAGLFSADRLHHYDVEIAPKLAEGCWVVSDRYVLSSLVYQGLDLPTSWIVEINRYAAEPDLTLLIDAAADVAQQRRDARGGVQEVFDDLHLQVQLRERYRKLISEHQSVVVDGNGDAASIHGHVMQALSDWLP